MIRKIKKVVIFEPEEVVENQKKVKLPKRTKFCRSVEHWVFQEVCKARSYDREGLYLSSARYSCCAGCVSHKSLFRIPKIIRGKIKKIERRNKVIRKITRKIKR